VILRAWAIGGIALLVLVLLLAGRHPKLVPLFRWLPVPLWCYFLPAIAVHAGWLPQASDGYQKLAYAVLPLALGCLLIGIDVPAVLRVGRRAWAAALAGAAGIVAGAVLGVWGMRAWLPAEAWMGAGALAGTWTGGTMNLLALRAVLNIPDPVFAPLILVDALVAYAWMAVLVAASGMQPAINRWLHADMELAASPAASATISVLPSAWLRGAAVVGGLYLFSRAAAWRLPLVPPLISSAAGWTVLLMTTGSLLCAMTPLRRLGRGAESGGYLLLYMVLAATGAQANWTALLSTPAWLAVGFITVLVHGMAMLAAGRWLRLPLGVLATASQANLGGVVSAPLVGAVYAQALVPIGLLLALAGNAAGTYVGWLAAWISRWLLGAG